MKENRLIKWIGNTTKNKRYFILAFLIPMLAVLIADIALGVFPFGERAPLIIDSYHQYGSFFSEFYEKILGGGSMLYTWNGGMGINFWAIAAYYLFSPFNIIFLIFPRALMLEAFTFIIMLKVACSGLTFAYYISKHYKKNDISIVFFSVFYALSGWVIGYNWNIMWLDCVVLLPLIILGLERLVKDGKGLMYGITLGCCIAFNYYIAIMVCIFMVLYFFVLFIQKRKKTFKLFIRRGLSFISYSLLGGGLAAVVILPAMYALMKTHSAETGFPETLKFYNSFVDIMSQQFAFTTPTKLSGLPNLYCGVIVLLFVVLYIFRKRTPLRYKVPRLILLVFLILSCNVNVLDFIWHGFHFPNSLPNRFTFIYIFLTLTMCYEVYLMLKEYAIWQYCVAFFASMLFVVAAYMWGKESREIYVYIITMALIWAYFLIISFYKMNRRKRGIARIVLCCLLSLEAIANCVFGLCTNGSINRTSYNAKLDDAALIRDYIGDDDNQKLYRTELNEFKGRNNATWLGFKSISMFSSTLSAGLDELIDHLGFFAAVNKFSYEGATRFTDDIFGVKYLVSEKNLESIRGFNSIQKVGEQYLYLNPTALSFGFMAKEEYADYVGASNYPWENLNEMAKVLSGVSEDIFEIEYIVGEPVVEGGTINKYDEYKYYLKKESGASSTTMTYTYTPTYTRERYIYFESAQMSKLTVTINGTSRSFSDTRGHIVDLGVIGPEDTVELKYTLKDSSSGGYIITGLFGLEETVYQQVYDSLAEEQLNVEKYTDTSIEGTIHANEDGIMYTSIPYDTGWKVYVDGKKVETFSVNDSLMYIHLTAGEHTIKMTYMPTGFMPGLIISLLCLAIAVVVYMRARVKVIRASEKNEIYK